MLTVYLARSSRKDKKYMVRIEGATVHFGAAGMSDYTLHKDPARKRRYIIRHRAHERWTKGGVRTPGFWSRWLLWGEPTIAASIAAMSRRFNLRIVRVTPARFKTLD